MTMANVDYWRTIRDFTSNASVIADQSQDVLTFRGGDNISLEFNEGDDIITWNADISSAAEGLRSSLSVVNSNVTSDPSMLEYDPNTGIFTYYPPDLSVYATQNYVNQSINDAITNLDLSEYATQKWVEDYITDDVIPLIPDVSDYVTQQDFNNWMSTINSNVLTPPSNTYAELPINPPLGIRYYVTDSNVSVQGNFGSTNFVGGGSNIVPVYYTTSPSGNVWIIG